LNHLCGILDDEHVTIGSRLIIVALPASLPGFIEHDIVGTLQTEYIQPSSQDNEQDVHPHVTPLQYWTLPSSQGGIWCCHVSSGSRSYLPAREGFGVTTCLTASDPASMLGRAPVPPHVQWLQILPPCSRGLWCCRMSHGSGPRLIAREGSSVATCPMAPDPTSPLGRALVSPCVPQL
jgi:hypothetical protein